MVGSIVDPEILIGMKCSLGTYVGDPIQSLPLITGPDKVINIPFTQCLTLDLGRFWIKGVLYGVLSPMIGLPFLPPHASKKGPHREVDQSAWGLLHFRNSLIMSIINGTGIYLHGPPMVLRSLSYLSIIQGFIFSEKQTEKGVGQSCIERVVRTYCG